MIQQFALYFEGNALAFTWLWDVQNFTKLASTWIFVESLSFPLEYMCLSILQHTSTLLLIYLLDHHDVVNEMNQ